jgi:alpha-N-arabinofuranosidase
LTRIAIDPARPVGRLDRKVFGGFVEHLGRCIYGGLYEEGSPLSDDRGFRKDVLGLLRELRLGVLRWPGGNFVKNCHWADGTGPKDARPRRPELAWGGEESNRFGTDEYLAYCAELGTEPYICLNMGTGTLEEALAWVEYCNSAAKTAWAARRRENGRGEPWRVTYWGLGNEMYGDWQVGAFTAEEYVREATRPGDYRLTLLVPAGQVRSLAGSAPGPPGGDTECMIRLGWKWTATQWVKNRKRSLT